MKFFHNLLFLIFNFKIRIQFIQNNYYFIFPLVIVALLLPLIFFLLMTDPDSDTDFLDTHSVSSDGQQLNLFYGKFK